MQRFLTGRKLFLLAIALLLSSAARAQTGIYAAFTASKFDTTGTDWIYGPTLGLYHDSFHLPFVSLGLDARAAILGSGNDTKITSGLVGPRLSIHAPLVPIRPYVEGLIGAGHVTIGQGTTHKDALLLDTGFAAGADMTIFPRLDWRIAEYSFTTLPGLYGGTDQHSISTGLVFRIPVPIP
ncbi:MAG TPA: hypothetical protein VGC07_03410 [Granulicella sp.]